MATSSKPIKPEELVRQETLQILKNQLSYRQSDIEIEFSIQLGSSRKRLDIAVFYPNQAHTQENIWLIVECKKATTTNTKSAQEQLKSYLSACVNAQFGVVVSSAWTCFEKKSETGFIVFQEISKTPDCNGELRRINYIIHAPRELETQKFTSEKWKKPFEKYEELDFTQKSVNKTHSKSNPLTENLLNVLTLPFLMMIIGLLVIFVSQNNQSNKLAREITEQPSTSVISTVKVEISPSVPRIPATLTFSPIPTPVSTTHVFPTRHPTSTFNPTLTPTSLGFATHYPTAEVYTVNNQKALLRTSPNTNSLVLKAIESGTVVYIIETSEDSRWLHVELDDGTKGWIAEALIKK